MVEADPKLIISHLSRRGALKRAAGAAATATGLAPRTAPAASLPHADAALLALEAELRVGEAAWQHALDRMAHAETRLFALRPVPPAAILIPDPDGGPPILPARWSTLRRHLARVHAGSPDRDARLVAAHRAWHAHRAALAR